MSQKNIGKALRIIENINFKKYNKFDLSMKTSDNWYIYEANRFKERKGIEHNICSLEKTFKDRKELRF